ncbi:MAG: hypothetical protein JXB00_05870 [Bacteroidales bacterium]|nr:hypothetical protein [Bacteroidales bacterium]
MPKCIAAVMVMMVLLSGFGNAYAGDPNTLSNDRNKLQLNPEYKLKRLSTGKVIIFTNKADGEVVRHEFEDIFAEVLLGALRRQTVDQLVPVVARKYYYSEDECRREIKHAINVLEAWDILVPRKPEVL